MALGPRFFRAVAVAWVLALGLLLPLGNGAVGQSSNGANKGETAPKTFLGTKIKPKPGIYVVTKDVNVRAKPETKSKRVGRFRKGERITTVGKATGAGWRYKKTERITVSFTNRSCWRSSTAPWGNRNPVR